ncbi:MAG: carboxylating nicotinate-nucleotide diphosphorylase [Bacteroidetes bacterium]|nr:carboxylating nicotinate-nucleotide diphosphorylase [Bacteroidota bacterium]
MFDIERFIKQALEEDVQQGDHTSLACINKDKKDTAVLKIKDDGIIAGIELAKMIFNQINPEFEFVASVKDGDVVNKGSEAFTVKGNTIQLLTAERLVLNCMQRMSGIATLTSQYVKAVEGTKAKILDTRKTTPLFRHFEKWAVKIGGGFNHRFGLYDMILIKDNHIDACGGIINAIESAKKYLLINALDLQIEIEARTLNDIEIICNTGGVNRILIDNFTPQNMKLAVDMVNNKFDTEASGGITLSSVKEYADTGVDYISTGALTHSYKSLDLSLKIVK